MVESLRSNGHTDPPKLPLQVLSPAERTALREAGMMVTRNTASAVYGQWWGGGGMMGTMGDVRER